MTFTDDDLKRLKGQFDTRKGVSNDDIIALIARLEAAEKTIYKWIELDDSIALGSSSDFETHNKIVEAAKEAMDAWQKAAGK